jgi:hypothetical protein
MVGSFAWQDEVIKSTWFLLFGQGRRILWIQQIEFSKRENKPGLRKKKLAVIGSHVYNYKNLRSIMRYRQKGREGWNSIKNHWGI